MSQEAAFRDWWDNRRDEELEAVTEGAGHDYAERVAFRAGWLAARGASASELHRVLGAPGQSFLGSATTRP